PRRVGKRHCLVRQNRALRPTGAPGRVEHQCRGEGRWVRDRGTTAPHVLSGNVRRFHEQRGGEVGEDRGALVTLEERVDGSDGRTELPAAEERNGERPAVGDRDGDPVAG